jgi:hypothetical protein
MYDTSSLRFLTTGSQNTYLRYYSGSNYTTISAYANDTAVHLGAITDIKIYHLFLRRYSQATGGITNFNKSEGVLCGAWRLSKPNLGISTALASKYLGDVIAPWLAMHKPNERPAFIDK